MLIDSHCHLDLLADSAELPKMLQEARTAGEIGWLVPGVSPEGWQAIAELQRTVPGVWAAFGIHPAHAFRCCDDDLVLLDRLLSGAVALGEVGLDKSAGGAEMQEAVLRVQIRMARQHGLPLLLHCRGWIGRLLTILDEERAAEVGGIMHAFSGSIESARQAISLGFAVSVSGVVTWPGARRSVQLATNLPLEWLVVESDAPDLSPQRFRGTKNRPGRLLDTVERIAELREMPVVDLMAALQATTRRVLRLG